MVQGVQTLEVRDDEDGMRLDRWIKLKFPDMTHSRLPPINAPPSRLIQKMKPLPRSW